MENQVQELVEWVGMQCVSISLFNINHPSYTVCFTYVFFNLFIFFYLFCCSIAIQCQYPLHTRWTSIRKSDRSLFLR